jgi:hypothetical protein
MQSLKQRRMSSYTLTRLAWYVTRPRFLINGPEGTIYALVPVIFDGASVCYTQRSTPPSLAKQWLTLKYLRRAIDMFWGYPRSFGDKGRCNAHFFCPYSPFSVPNWLQLQMSQLRMCRRGSGSSRARHFTVFSFESFLTIMIASWGARVTVTVSSRENLD